MSRKGGQSNAQYSKGLTYVAQKPSFLQNFGKPPPSPPRAGRGGVVREGRETIPRRPGNGEWAEGSGGESGDEEEEEEDEFGRMVPKGKGKGKEKGKEEEIVESDDEWGEVFGGGGDEGPQVVVLKEGRHLSAQQVRQERRRGE